MLQCFHQKDQQIVLIGPLITFVIQEMIEINQHTNIEMNRWSK